MILQNMTNASAISDEIMSVTFVEPKGTKTPSPAGTSSDTSEASPVKTETPSIPSPEPPLKIKAGTALKPRLKIELPENLTPVAVEDGTKGEGLPYAPEGFPNPEDKWIWKVGKRKNSSGYYGDRYLILPKSLQEGTKQVLFMSKNAAEKYMRKRFPEVDLESFFASFIWPVPSARRHGENGEMIVSSAKRGRKSNVIVHGRTPLKRACNAGNVKCCLETGKGKFYKPMDCDICCVESGFCRECSCILCGMCVDHDLDEYYFIKCQEKLREEFICGHVAHLDCAIICQTGGVVRSNGLDVEYYCRRCDKKTDLLKHVLGLITTPGSGKLRSDVENSLNLALRLIQGTQQTWCRSLENLIQKGVKKLQSGMELQDIFGDAQDNSGTGNAGMAQDFDVELKEMMRERVSHDRGKILMHCRVERGTLVSHAWPKIGVREVAHEGFQEVGTKLETIHKEDQGTQTEGPSGAPEPSIPVTDVEMVLKNLFDYTLPLDGLELLDLKLPCASPFTTAFAPALRALEMNTEQEKRIIVMDEELRAHERTIHAQESQIQDLQDRIKDMRFQLNLRQRTLSGPRSRNRLRSRTRRRIDNEPTTSGVSHRA